ncbi:MAG: molybdate ABC transporter substrate-binding protein [Hyphomicrobiales bacterium]|nr:molybdate ABC transporter substrate-binding protein [Hyphomicrobiales bacterium]HRA92503.1 molybdate ABC transporter substrate-binding protein [Aestuariivirga sp.]
MFSISRYFCVVVIAFLSMAFHAHAENVNVFAAASMKTALDDAIRLWKTQSGKEVVATYGSSGTLARQIAAAAPADIFISADLAWVDDIAKKSLIKPDSRRNLVGNTLVLVAAAGTGLKIGLEKESNLAASLGIEKLAVGDVKSVPAGKYAKSALENLGLWASVEPNLVMQENVRSALALVARGEARLGIVYGSDAVAESKVQVIASFPEASHAPIVYPVALIAASTNPDAQPFLDFLFSNEAQLIFKTNGFTLLE